MDCWIKIEAKLEAIKNAGIKEVGKVLVPQFKGGSSREEVLKEEVERQRRYAAWRAAHPGW